MVCLARQAAFSEMMSLAAHPEAKHGLAWPCDCELCVGGLSFWARSSTLGFAGGCYGTVNRRSEATLRDWWSTRGRASGERVDEIPRR